MKQRGTTRNRLPGTPINRDPLRIYPSSFHPALVISKDPINILERSAFRGTGSLLLNAYQSDGAKVRGAERLREKRGGF